MPTPPITAQTIDALAALLVSLRPGQRRWNARDITLVLQQAADTISSDPEQLTRAAVRAALTSSIVSPTVIAMTGEHWEHIAHRLERDPDPARFCAHCSHTHRATQPHVGVIHEIVDASPHIAAARSILHGTKSDANA